MEIGDMQLASVFGFGSDRQYSEETVLGYTFQFSGTLGKASWDNLLTSPFLLNALLAPDSAQEWRSFTANRLVGDAAFSNAVTPTGQTGSTRIDAFVFRRGSTGVVLLYTYQLGRRQTTVEDLAKKLDAKIQALASP